MERRISDLVRKPGKYTIQEVEVMLRNHHAVVLMVDDHEQVISRMVDRGMPLEDDPTLGEIKCLYNRECGDCTACMECYQAYRRRAETLLAGKDKANEEQWKKIVNLINQQGQMIEMGKTIGKQADWIRFIETRLKEFEEKYDRDQKLIYRLAQKWQEEHLDWNIGEIITQAKIHCGIPIEPWEMEAGDDE